MENYENKELLKDAAKKSLESLKDMKPGTDEYDKAANMALKLYDMQLKDEAQETEKQLKEDEVVRKEHEIELDQAKTAKSRKLRHESCGRRVYGWLDCILVDLRGWRCDAAVESNRRRSP